MQTLSLLPGSMPFDQLAPLLQLLLPPAPVQLSVHWATAGVAAASESATIAATNNTNLRNHFSSCGTQIIKPPGSANQSCRCFADGLELILQPVKSPGSPRLTWECAK